MSRVAKNPVVLPSGVEVTVQNGQVCVKGKNGNLSLSLPSCVSIKISILFLCQEQLGHYALIW